jgi:hypothetical protein
MPTLGLQSKLRTSHIGLKIKAAQNFSSGKYPHTSAFRKKKRLKDRAM